MSIEVIGAGLPRTGTLTQKLALEELGLGPCYHWVNVIADLDQVELWDRALDGEALWEEIFDGASLDGRLARGLLLPRADGLLSRRQGPVERARAGVVGAQLQGHHLDDVPRRDGDAPALARPRAGRSPLAALPGARRPHVLGPAGHVRRRARRAGAADRADDRHNEEVKRVVARGAAARVGGRPKAGSRCASSSRWTSPTGRCRTPTTATRSWNASIDGALGALGSWRESGVPVAG